MTLSTHPVIAFENLLRRTQATLSSADADPDFPLINMAGGNLGIVTLLGTGTSKQFVLDAGAPVSCGSLFLRFQAGWEDIASVRIRGAADSLLSSGVVHDETLTDLWPAEGDWPINIPRRPVVRSAWENVSAQYWGVDIERTGGPVDLAIAAAQFSPMVQLKSWVEGIAVFGTTVATAAATEEKTADVDTDFRFARSPRRTATVKLMAIPEAVARSSWYGKLQFAAFNSDILYIYNPAETDPVLMHNETLWGTGHLDTLTFVGANDWEGTLTIRERL